MVFAHHPCKTLPNFTQPFVEARGSRVCAHSSPPPPPRPRAAVPRVCSPPAHPGHFVGGLLSL